MTKKDPDVAKNEKPFPNESAVFTETDMLAAKDDGKVPAPATPPASATVMDVSLRQALDSIAAQQREFQQTLDAQRATIIAQQATIEKINSRNAAAAAGTIEVEFRHCNTCGKELAEGERCPKHADGGQINHVGRNAFGVMTLIRQT